MALDFMSYRFANLHIFIHNAIIKPVFKIFQNYFFIIPKHTIFTCFAFKGTSFQNNAFDLMRA